MTFPKPSLPPIISFPPGCRPLCLPSRPGQRGILRDQSRRHSGRGTRDLVDLRPKVENVEFFGDCSVCSIHTEDLEVTEGTSRKQGKTGRQTEGRTEADERTGCHNHVATRLVYLLTYCLRQTRSETQVTPEGLERVWVRISDFKCRVGLDTLSTTTYSETNSVTTDVRRTGSCVPLEELTSLEECRRSRRGVSTRVPEGWRSGN